MREVILKHSLINAIEHEGKADLQAVLGKVLVEKPDIKQKIKEIIPEIKEVVEEVNSLTIEQQKKRIEELDISLVKEKKIEENVLPELPNVIKGKVIMRLAPFPSGPLHIGNARPMILNDEYVKKYDGKLLLVIDDTIGSEEKFIVPESYKLIIDGLKWLDIKFNKIYYKSDRLKIYYKIAEELIKKDGAYVCECNADVLRKNRIEGIECNHRKQSINKNIEKWKQILKGKYKEGQAVLRLKTDMKHENPAFRDRVLFRIAERKHPRVGKKYKVWPMLEFSWACDDSLLNITHVLRGKDLLMEDVVEEYIWDILMWRKPDFVHHGIMRLEGLKLSKTESRKAIEKKVFIGWDDPRTWSLQSLMKRGFQPQSIRNFVIKMGLSLADVSVPVEILYAENRKLIDSKANRYFAVLDPVMISVKKTGKLKSVKVNLHPDFPKRGKRKIPVNVDKICIEREDFEKFHDSEIGLMNLFSVNLKRNSELTSKEVKYEIPKIHWVSEPNVKIKIIMPNGKVKTGLAEPNVKDLKINELIQFYRIGFCRVDKVGKREIVLYFAHK
jgi:glutamyl-tRNA synthetase